MGTEGGRVVNLPFPLYITRSFSLLDIYTQILSIKSTYKQAEHALKMSRLLVIVCLSLRMTMALAVNVGCSQDSLEEAASLACRVATCSTVEVSSYKRSSTLFVSSFTHKYLMAIDPKGQRIRTRRRPDYVPAVGALLWILHIAS